MKYYMKINGIEMRVPGKCCYCQRALNLNKPWTLYVQASEYWDAHHKWWLDRKYPMEMPIIMEFVFGEPFVGFCDWSCHFLALLNIWIQIKKLTLEDDKDGKKT